MKKWIMLIAAVGLLAGTAGADIWEDLAKYKMGDAVEEPAPVRVEALITETPLGQRGPVEDALVKIVESKSATPEARWFACRMLQRVGTDKCVPALAKLLGDDRMSHFARLALQRMGESEKAGEALRGALDGAPDNLKPGIMGSIAERRDKKAIRQIGKLTASKDAAVAGAALAALGKIGGKRSKKAIENAQVAGGLKSVKLDALLAYAEGAGDAGTFKAIYENEKSQTHRAAALAGLVAADESQGAPIVVELLKGDDSYLRKMALGLTALAPGAGLTRAVARSLGEMGVETRAQVVSLLGERGDRAALSAVAQSLKSDDRELREAAIAAVGLLGGAESVKPLLQQAKTESYNKAAMESIASMTGDGVDGALVGALSDDGVKAPAIQAIAERYVVRALPALKKLTSGGSADVRKAAWDGLAVLASASDLDGMMKMMLAVRDEGEKKIAQAAMKDICSGASDKNACLDAVSPYYDKSGESAKLFILEVAAVGGGSRGLELTRRALQSGEKALYDKAVRTLSSWPNEEAAPDLLDLAKNAPDEKTRILSLRGYIQVVGKSGNQGKKVEMLEAVQGLVKRVDEKRLFIGTLRNTKHPDALKMLTGYLADSQAKAEAQAAAVDLAKSLTRGNPEDVAEAMAEVLKDPDANKSVLKRAKDLLDQTASKKNRGNR